jgi:O-6-methylguanine DNA methyltransferase
MSPPAAGAGEPEVVHVARFDSPLGALRVASTARGLAFLELPHASGRGLSGWLRRQPHPVEVAPGLGRQRDAMRQILEYLEGRRREFALPLDLRGTPFQLQVWRALLEIPYGETRSYGEIARAVGRPGATRAVGNANGANPVALVVPCHRVIQSGGRLGGFGGGVELKARLLALERAAPSLPEQRLL